MNNRRLIKRLLLAFFILGLLVVHFIVPRFITEIHHPLIDFVRPTLSHRKHFEQDALAHRQEEIEYISLDGWRQKARVTFPAKGQAKATVILVHGIRGNKDHFEEIAQRLAGTGYLAVAVDLRAHGASEGQHCTFGFRERNDIKVLIDRLGNLGLRQGKIGIWGQSLGGAVALQALAVDERIQFGIVESTFADFSTITNDYFHFFLGFSIRPFTDYLVWRAGHIADFEPENVVPSEACKSIEQPILMVHGTKDQRIKIDYGRLNYANLASTKKEFVEVEGAGHLDVWKVGGEAYLQRVFQFLAEETSSDSVRVDW